VKPLLSPADVAKQCGLSRRAVYRAIERGELAASRVCSHLRVRPEDVDAWLAATLVAPPGRRAPKKIAHPEPLARLPARGGLRNLLSSS
jgi:excisionase family DNA binding protein